jgi:hypothetical protein
MTIIGKGFIKKAIHDFSQIDTMIDDYTDKLDDNMSYLEARNVFLEMKREIGKIIEPYKKQKEG